MGTTLRYYLIFFMVSLSAQQGELLEHRNLDQLTFSELADRQMEAYKEDDHYRLRILGKIHVEKAKEAKDPIETALGYMYRTVIEEAPVGLQYADSMILVTQGSEHPDFPTMGHFLKAGIHYDEGQYRKALASYSTAYRLALKKHNRTDQRDITMNIAAIRNFNGQPGIAANLYHRALYLLKQESDYEQELYEEHLLLLHNLALAHLRLNQLDSAKHYTALGSKLALGRKDRETFRDFVLIGAQADYFAGFHESAKDTLLKYISELEPEPKAVKWYYLGKIAQNQNRPDKAIAYFKSIDSLLDITHEPFPETKEIYLQLMAHAAENGNKDAQLAYIDKLIRFDSILALEKQGVSDQAVVAYDIPYLKAQRRSVSDALDARKKLVYGLMVLLVLSSTAGVYFYMRNHRMTRRVQELTSEPEIDWKPKPTVTDEVPDVPADIRNHILKELEAFEASDRCAKPTLDRATLAKQMGTNTTYLSNVVNHYKKMTFPTYLRELRIAKAIPRLTHDTELLKFNYGGLAQEFGFGSADSFAKALYQRTGVYPSKFLKELEQRKRNDDL